MTSLDLPAWLGQSWAHSGLAPFLAGLVTAELCHRLRFSGLAAIAGLVACAVLVLGTDGWIAPSTPAGRIVTAALAGAALGLVLDLAGPLQASARYVAPIVAAAAALWVGWPALASKSGGEAALLCALIGGCAATVGWSTVTVITLSERCAAAGTAAGLTAGACMLAAGPSPLASLAFAAGAAGGAHLLIQVLSGQRLPAGALFALPLALSTAAAPAAAMLGGTLAWPLLPLLALVPVAAQVPLPEHMGVRARAILILLACAIPGGAALALRFYGPAWALA